MGQVQSKHRAGERSEAVGRATIKHAILVAFALLVSPLVAGCMPDTPETQLTWDANTRMHKSQARADAPAAGAKTYTYQDKYATPTPRPNPAVTSQPLPPVAANAPAFAWPVSGRVISDFGSTATGGKNDGINIATAQGAPIHASASGTVTYAGDELKDYGNLVLLKHTGGYTTAYAHAERLVVQKRRLRRQGPGDRLFRTDRRRHHAAAAFRNSRQHHAGQSAQLPELDHGVELIQLLAQFTRQILDELPRHTPERPPRASAHASARLRRSSASIFNLWNAT